MHLWRALDGENNEMIDDIKSFKIEKDETAREERHSEHCTGFPGGEAKHRKRKKKITYTEEITTLN